jgi:hypothetical protein
VTIGVKAVLKLIAKDQFTHALPLSLLLLELPRVLRSRFEPDWAREPQVNSRESILRSSVWATKPHVLD